MMYKLAAASCKYCIVLVQVYLNDPSETLMILLQSLVLQFIGTSTVLVLAGITSNRQGYSIVKKLENAYMRAATKEYCMPEYALCEDRWKKWS
jgi:hypothetical protein